MIIGKSALDLAASLAARLVPWAVTIAVLIGLGPPLTYYLLQSAAIQRTATIRARAFASRLEGLVLDNPTLWRFDAEKQLALVASFIRDRDFVRVRVTDDAGEEIAGLAYADPEAKAWWHRAGPASASVLFNDRRVGTVEVEPSDRRLWITTGVLLLVSVTLGSGLAIVVYLVPVRIVRGMERGIHDLLDAVEASNVQLMRRARDLSTLLDVARLTGATLPEAELYRLIADHALKACGVSRCAIVLTETPPGSLRIAAVRTADGGATVPIADERVPREAVPALAQAIDAREPFVPRAASRADAPVPTALVPPGGRVAAVVPLVHRDEALGVLVLAAAAEAPPLDAPQVALAMTLAGQAALAIANARLLASLRHALDDLTQAQERLVEAEKVRAVGVLAGGMAHHLNNLLTIIVGRVELLLPSLEPHVRPQLAIVQRAARDSADIVRRLHAFARTQPAAADNLVELNPLVEDVVQLVRGYCESDPVLQARPLQFDVRTGDVPAVAADGRALREALLNVVMNAIDAMPEGGTVTVTTSATPEQACCVVTDTGIGMPDVVRQRALEPFFTTKGPKRTGLGLSTAYGIASRHGGTLAIDSTPGKGTTVTLTLRLGETSRRS